MFGSNAPPSCRWLPLALAGVLALAVMAQPTFAQQTPADTPPDHSHHQTPAAQPPATPDHTQHQHTTPPSTPKPAAAPDHTHHQHTTPPAAPKAPAHKHTAATPHRTHPPGHSTTKQPHTNHATHDLHGDMKAFLGPYGITREASGTSWVPDTTPHEGIHAKYGAWLTMWHGYLNLVHDVQTGPRGGNKTFVNGMVMFMAQRPLGDGTFGLRAMLSPDPFMGKSGYPLLFAAGETADGQTHLVDRQHPHELFMELAATYSRPLSATSSVFVYVGLPGEPALGPPAFMHRTSGMDIPEAPITHHWLDSTHITFGVVTGGLIVDNWKIEASAFRGREPDQNRYDIEAPKLDSFAARLSWNPIRELSMQLSWGRLNSPEQLAQGVNEDRLTASATYTQPFGSDNVWSTTAAWGRKMLRPGETLDGFMLETAVILQKTYTVFARAERVASNELTHDIVGLDGRVFAVGKLSVGGIYDFYRTDHVKAGIGGLVSKFAYPAELTPLYGSNPTGYMVFARLKVL